MTNPPRRRRDGYAEKRDYKAEQEIIDAVLASQWGGRRWTGSERPGDAYNHIDRVMIARDGRRGPGLPVSAFAEVKDRPKFSPASMKTVLLDVNKWQHLTTLYEQTMAPTYWFARFPQEDNVVAVYDFAGWRRTIRSELFECRYGGRKDRDDPEDIQPLIYIDRGEFKTLAELDDEVMEADRAVHVNAEADKLAELPADPAEREWLAEHGDPVLNDLRIRKGSKL